MADIEASSLLVVDAQQGFSELCPTELPVPGALAIVPIVNRLLGLPWRRIDASQDWHPPGHCSFREAGGVYPPHCVAGTPGADFLPGLDTHRFHTVWRKGHELDRDAYAVTAQHPAFAAFLRAEGVESVVVCGLTANICCFYSARDLRKEGFDVCIVEDATVGIDVPEAGLWQTAARAEAEKLGIRYVTSRSLGA